MVKLNPITYGVDAVRRTLPGPDILTSDQTRLLVFGWNPPVAVELGLLAAATAVPMAVYVAAIVSVWARGLSIDCGCFGGGGAVTAGAVPGDVVDILRDVVLAGAAAVLIRRPVTECSCSGETGSPCSGIGSGWRTSRARPGAPGRASAPWGR